jgi:hypothetical protein
MPKQEPKNATLTLCQIPAQMADAIQPVERKRRSQQRLSRVLDSHAQRGDELRDVRAVEGARRDELRQREAVQRCTPKKIPTN